MLAYLKAPPAAAVPRVVVLDNASIHTSKAVKAHRQALAGGGTCLHHPPPYSPKLNRIEPVFKVIKRCEMPTRGHATRAELRRAAEQGPASYASRLAARSNTQLRQAA